MNTKDTTRFEQYFNKGSGCWVWTGALAGKTGYGQFWLCGKNAHPHRVSYELYKGPVPEGLCVLHTCDNRACINPAHLFLGTYQDNHNDMHAKDRGNVGERHGMHKLTAMDVRQIKRLHARGHTQTKIGQFFGVWPSTISDIVRGILWKRKGVRNAT